MVFLQWRGRPNDRTGFPSRGDLSASVAVGIGRMEALFGQPWFEAGKPKLRRGYRI